MRNPSRRTFVAAAGVTVGTATAGGLLAPAARAATEDPADAASRAVRTGDLITVTPDQPRYADLVSGFNPRWEARPEGVRLPRTTAQVVRAVQDAADKRQRLTVRGGGHCYEDFVYNPEVEIVVDMNLMNAVGYDPGRRAFEVEAGATLLKVYQTLYEGWGVTVPGGVCYAVGVGGHVAGGGYGNLSRKHGLVVDHLYAVEVVTLDAGGRARAIVATREPNDPHRDLWWAHTGGGGGNFGVVTRYWFRSADATGSDPSELLPKPPAEVVIAVPTWSWENVTRSGFAAMVRAYGTWFEQNSGPDPVHTGLTSWLFLNHRVSGSLALLLQVNGDVPQAEQRARDFVRMLSTALGVPHAGDVVRLPWLKAASWLGTMDSSQTNPQLRAGHKSAYMRKGFPEDQIAAVWKHLTRTDYTNPRGGLAVVSFGGRINTVAPDATALPQRDAIFKLLYQTYWSSPEDDAVNTAWLQEFYREVYAGTGGVPVSNRVTDGCYVNYADRDLSDPQQNTSNVPWSTLYYKDNYPKLQRVKQSYDPKDFFRHRQSVRLPGSVR
ncbi:FAD-binding oxidoreductase [Kitasatospora sp. NPDC056327]|uniref:FAD-binding oxidoreductase n=1 Tax=Kitasatospora sp. NPDC056327 TaxID=3345785 RepID=UPI0035D5AEE8